MQFPPKKKLHGDCHFLYYFSKYPNTPSASKHGQAFAGFKSWRPTISARGKIRFNSRSSASNEAFCSNVRVSAGKLAASSPPS